MRFFRFFPAFAVVAALLTSGCATHAPNPSFNVSNGDAKAALREMTRDARPLPRPLVILGGLDDPGIAANVLRDDFRELSGDDPRVIGVSFFMCGSFDGCRKRVIDAVDDAFPSDDPVWTTEVDVVAVSMGGLVARYSAAEPTPAKSAASSTDASAASSASQPTTSTAPTSAPARRLRIARLFTISSPHRGAALAFLPTFNQLQIDVRAGSKFLRRLDACDGLAASNVAAHTRPTITTTGGYELIPYVRLNDVIVGESNAAPAGWAPRWVPAEPFQDSHMFAIADPRIVADIARRLRGESPLTTDPPAPLPAD